MKPDELGMMLQDLRHELPGTHSHAALMERVCDWLDLHEVPMLLAQVGPLVDACGAHEGETWQYCLCCGSLGGHAPECAYHVTQTLLERVG